MGLLATAIKLISNTVSLRRLQSESIPQKPCSPRSWCLRTGTLNMVYPKSVMMSWEQSHQMSRMRQVSRGVSHHFEIRHESCVWVQKQKQAVNTLVSKQTKLKLFLKQMLFFFYASIRHGPTLAFVLTRVFMSTSWKSALIWVFRPTREKESGSSGSKMLHFVHQLVIIFSICCWAGGEWWGFFVLELFFLLTASHCLWKQCRCEQRVWTKPLRLQQ